MNTPDRTIYLVATVPFGNTLIRRAIDRFIRLTGILPPLHRYGIDALIPWKKPIRSPHAISIHLLHELKKHGRVRFYSMYEKGVIHLKHDDIFIGQPTPLGGFGTTFRPNTDDPESITSQTLRINKNTNHNKFLLTPYANDPLLVSWMKNIAEEYADKIILIATGEIWTKDWIDTPFGAIPESRILRVDNAIDPNEYPLVKKTFNPAGQRKFLYIGHTAWYKNTAQLEKIAESIPGFAGGHIGGGTVKGWKKIADFAQLTPEFMTEIAKEYDIFVNTSSGDAQATTILESICFGFPVACTPQTGYEQPSISKLHTEDTAYNVRILTQLQNMTEDELRKLVSESKKYVEEKHTWKIFLEKAIVFINIQ